MHSRVSFIQLRSTLPASMRALGKKLRDRCMHSLLGIDAFILQGYDILRLSHDANARPLGLLTWDVHERLHNWLDKAPRRALTPVVWQLWGQLVVLNIKQVYSPHTVRYPRADLARLDQYLRCIAALLPEQLMVQAQCTDDLDNHWVPVYEELVEVLRCFSKPDSEKYRSNLFLRDFITGYGWDPRALLEQLQRIEGFCPQGATSGMHSCATFSPCFWKRTGNPSTAMYFPDFGKPICECGGASTANTKNPCVTRLCAGCTMFFPSIDCTPLRLLHGPWTHSMPNPCRSFFHCSRVQFKNKIMGGFWKYRARY